MAELSQILLAVERGGEKSSECLLPLVYEELRRLAVAKMSGEPENQTLQPTVLVHEAWLRLTVPGEVQWQNRGPFFGAAAEAMRRILIEKARRRQAAKRGGGSPLMTVRWPEGNSAWHDGTAGRQRAGEGCMVAMQILGTPRSPVPGVGTAAD